MEKKIVKLIINDEEDPNEYLSELVIINFNILSNLIWNLKKIRKNQIEFIRFKNIDNSWELISITSPDINITNLKSLNIMIQLIKKEKSDPDIESMIKKVKNLKSSIEQERKKKEMLSNAQKITPTISPEGGLRSKIEGRQNHKRNT